MKDALQVAGRSARGFRGGLIGWVAFAVLLSSAWSAEAAVLGSELRSKMLDYVLANAFWGHAKFSDGTPVQPATEDERKQLPISRAVAERVLDTAELSGQAVWCEIDWAPNFRAMMSAARKSGLSETQLAFMGVIHGFAQSTTHEIMQKREPVCAPERKEGVRAAIAASLAKGREIH
jgi:hypothetical protein